MHTVESQNQSINYTSNNNYNQEIGTVENSSENILQLDTKEHRFEEITALKSTHTLKGALLNPKAKPANIQAKLKIGQAKDIYEQEADRIADMIVQQISSDQIHAKEQVEHKMKAPLFQRKYQDSESAKKEHRKKKKASLLQLKVNNGQARTYAPDIVTQKLLQRKGQGSPLSPKVQDQMEQSFNTDFSQVRVHTDGEAVQLNQQLGARAFTYGSDVYFNRGEFQPTSIEGQRLLAHELTHVVQQGEYSGEYPKVEKLRNIYQPGKVSGPFSSNLVAKNISKTLQMKQMTGAEANEEIAQDRLYEILCHEYAYASFVTLDNFIKLGKLGYIPQGPYKGAYDFQMWVFSPNSVGKRRGLETVVAFTGTNSLQDLVEDFQHAGVGIRQFARNLSIIRNQLNRISKPVVVCGHSLGGALAQLTAAVFPQFISRIITFQSPGIPIGFVRALQKYNSEVEPHKQVKAHHYKAAHDIIDDVGEAIAPGLIYEVSSDDLPDNTQSNSEIIRAGKAHTSFPLKNITSSSGRSRSRITVTKHSTGAPEYNYRPLESIRQILVSVIGDGLDWSDITKIDNQLRSWIFSHPDDLPKLKTNQSLLLIEILLRGPTTDVDVQAILAVINAVPKEQLSELRTRLEPMLTSTLVNIGDRIRILLALEKWK